MAINPTIRDEFPSKHNPFGEKNEGLRAGREFRRIVDEAKTVEQIISGATEMYDRGFMRVPGEMVIRAISDFNDRLFKEAETCREKAKARVKKRINSVVRLAIASRTATRNHVRGW